MAASTSAWPPCATRASTWRVAGLMVSNDSPVCAATQAPPMYRPNAPPWDVSHSSAGPLASGAGPHSMVSKMRATGEVVVMSYHRVTVGGAVVPRHVVLKLPLDIGEQC